MLKSEDLQWEKQVPVEIAKALIIRTKRQHVDGLIWECQHKGWLAEVKFYEQGEPCVVISNPHWVNDGESLDDLLEGYYQSGKIYR